MSTQTTAITKDATTPPGTPKGLVTTFAERFDVNPQTVFALVRDTVFKSSSNEPPLTNEETVAALIVCNAYNLNPFTKEIYAFRSKGKLLIVVGVDGWSTIVNRHPAFNGVEFEEHFDNDGAIQAVTCKIHRKDRTVPIIVTEYTRECFRDTDPWKKMPIRMTRNRAFVQCSRIALGISGILDEDEAATIQGHPIAPGETKLLDVASGATRTETVKNAVAAASKARGKNGGTPPAQGQAQNQTEAPQAETTQATVIDAQDTGQAVAQPTQQAPAQQEQVQQVQGENW